MHGLWRGHVSEFQKYLTTKTINSSWNGKMVKRQHALFLFEANEVENRSKNNWSQQAYHGIQVKSGMELSFFF